MAGAPTKYQTKYNKKAYKLCLMGATDADLAEFFDVCEDTINEWKKVHKQFSESIKKGKLDADADVAASLYKRAIGYQVKEVTFEKVGDKETLVATGDNLVMSDEYRKKIVIKEQASDTTAAIFWLKNRQPSKWRDKQEIDHTSKGQQITLPSLTPERAKEIRKALDDEI
jgi:hypothetical protein